MERFYAILAWIERDAASTAASGGGPGCGLCQVAWAEPPFAARSPQLRSFAQETRRNLSKDTHTIPRRGG